MRMGSVAEVVRAERSLIRFVLIASMVILLTVPAWAKTVVFWQPGFPTVDSQSVERISLEKALDGMDARFADIRSLNEPATLANAELLILPYGSAFPADGWKTIEEYLHSGGNLLIVGGQPLRVPVAEANGKYVASAAQDTYARALDFRHTCEVPVTSDAQFAWKFGYEFTQKPQIHARRFFAVEGHLDGLGFMKNEVGELIAAPVIVADRTSNSMPGSRIVALDFDPQSDYWKSQDGIALIRQSAQYASQGATQFTIETFFSALRVGESPLITVHLRNQRQGRLGNPVNGEVKLTLASENGNLNSATLPVIHRGNADVTAPFSATAAARFLQSCSNIQRRRPAARVLSEWLLGGGHKDAD